MTKAVPTGLGGSLRDDTQSSRGQRSDVRIHEAVKHAVLTQKLPPGSRLPELTLSEIFGVSRSVVRKALLSLANDHIISMRRNQIARVARPSLEETHEVFDARRLIEVEVLRQVAESIEPASARALLELVDQEYAAHERQDQDRRIHLSVDFHDRIADLCPNRTLAEMLGKLILRTSVIIALYKVPGMAACFRGSDHRGIAEALQARDGKRAGEIAVEHLNELEERLVLGDRNRAVDLKKILRG
ncbi:MAG: GntR family transcriptional regulator [Ectothiorhodospiraceae bacterium]